MSRPQTIMRFFRERAGRRVSIFEICERCGANADDRVQRNRVNAAVQRAIRCLARYGIHVRRVSPRSGNGNFGIYEVPQNILEL